MDRSPRLAEVGGKRRRVKARVRSHAEALAKFDKLRTTYVIGKRATTAPTVAESLTSWIARRRPQLAAKSVRSYETGIANLTVNIGHVRLDKLTADHIRGTMTAIKDKEHAKKEVARDVVGDSDRQVAYDTLRAALNREIKKDQLRIVSPLGTVERPATEREIDYLNRDKAKALLRAVADDRYRTLFHVAFSLGLRLGEISALHWRDVDLGNHTLLVTKTLSEARAFGKTKTRTWKPRVDIPSSSIVDELRARQKRNRKLKKITELVSPRPPDGAPPVELRASALLPIARARGAAADPVR